MTIALIVIFCAGVVNFAMHRAMLESNDPVVVAAMKPFQDRLGTYSTYAVEYLFLVAGLAIGSRHALGGLMMYGIYSALNILAFKMMRNRSQ
jgi:hypothetical protein